MAVDPRSHLPGANELANARTTLVAGSSNPLLDELQARLTRLDWSTARVSIAPADASGRIGVWADIIGTGLRGVATSLGKGRVPLACHFLGPGSLLVGCAAALAGRPFAVHFWGSDYHYWKRRNNPILRWILRKARFVSFANTAMLDDARIAFGQEPKFRVLRFGIETLDCIDRIAPDEFPACRSPKIDAPEVRVVVGTNSQPGQQHLLIIDAIEGLKCDLKDRCLFIFPLNYGNRDHRKTVLHRLERARFRHAVLDDFLRGPDLALFRLRTDVLIQVQRHDAFSGAMLESMYAGSRVITGGWLPYDDLRRQGVDWIELDDITDLGESLERALARPLAVDRNREIVRTVACWERLAPQWLEAYRSLEIGTAHSRLNADPTE